MKQIDLTIPRLPWKPADYPYSVRQLVIQMHQLKRDAVSDSFGYAHAMELGDEVSARRCQNSVELLGDMFFACRDELLELLHEDYCC